MKLGKLKKFDLREYWKHKAVGRTKWVMKPEDLGELGKRYSSSL